MMSTTGFHPEIYTIQNTAEDQQQTVFDNVLKTDVPGHQIIITTLFKEPIEITYRKYRLRPEKEGLLFESESRENGVSGLTQMYLYYQSQTQDSPGGAAARHSASRFLVTTGTCELLPMYLFFRRNQGSLGIAPCLH